MSLKNSYMEETFRRKNEGRKGHLLRMLNIDFRNVTNEKSIIIIVNRLLSTIKHRKEGLEYLNSIMNSCSFSVIVENSLNWVNHCIIKYPDDILREVKLKVLGQIIEAAHDDSDFNKRFISDYVAKAFDNCLTTSHVNPYECKVALTTLTTFMKYYPGWFGQHIHQIECFILVFLDTEDPGLVQAAALAFHYLQQVGSSGANEVNHKSNFTHTFHKLCRTVHKLYVKLFESDRNLFHSESSENDTFEFHSVPSQEEVLHVYARRIQNVFKFIEVMIRTRFPVNKETKPKYLLDVITRATSIHKCLVGGSGESLDPYQFSVLLLEIQSSALKLLRLLIIWYQSNCLPFSYSISKLLVDSLERSHKCDCFNTDSLHQESAYRALSEWISVSKNSLHPQFQSVLLECILKDITPLKAHITLTVSDSSTGKKSQKAKRRAMVDRIISGENQSSSKESSTSCEKLNGKLVCRFALTTLRCLLESTRLDVKPNLLKCLCNSVFDSLKKVQSARSLSQYTDIECQAKLYGVLIAIYHPNTLSILPPLHTSLDILSRGAKHRNRFIASTSQNGLTLLESFCQPVCPSLYLGLEKDEEDVERSGTPPEEIGVEHMEADEDSERNSVDFDASTDEFPNHERSEVLGNRSTIDDEASVKGTDIGDFGVEELNSDISQTESLANNEMNVAQDPVVTSPSDDGNEILKGQNFEKTHMETVPGKIENGQEENKSKESSFEKGTQHEVSGSEETVVLNDDNEADSTEPGETVEIDSTNQNTPDKNKRKVLSEVEQVDVIDASGQEFEQVIISGEKGQKRADAVSIIHRINSPEPCAKNSMEEIVFEAFEEPTVQTEQQTIAPVSHDRQASEVANSVDDDSREPSAKRPKIIPEEDTPHTPSENGDKIIDDPDASYLEDDSFVDDVKDYY